MPKSATPGADRFFRKYRAMVRENQLIAAALKKRWPRDSQRAHVAGYGVGLKNDRPAAVFLVRKKVPAAKLAKADVLPAFITVGGRKVPTRVTATGRNTLYATPIGHNEQNIESYHTAGQGDWKMGTQITPYLPHMSTPYPDGTAGARVHTAGKRDEHWLLSCGHVLQKAGFDIAQAEKNRKDVVKTPADLNHYVGSVSRVAPFSSADAGIVECAGAQVELLNIGKPAAMQFPLPGMWVQKSGRTTGVTYSRITEVSVQSPKTKYPDNKLYGLAGCFRVKNSCTWDANVKVNPGAPRDLFGWKGDSGSLIVAGKPDSPGVFGVPRLQDEYDRGSAADRRKIRDKWERAALGLLISGDDTSTYGQEISWAAVSLNILLDE